MRSIAKQTLSSHIHNIRFNVNNSTRSFLALKSIGVSEVEYNTVRQNYGDLFPIIRIPDIHGPCLPLKKRQICFAAIHYRPIKAFVAKSVQRRLKNVTEPLLYDNIQVGNSTILHRRRIQKGVCRISHLLHV